MADRISRSIEEPIREIAGWDECWLSHDRGLVAAWEAGRQQARQKPDLALRAKEGQLVTLPWKGGAENLDTSSKKYGTLHYVAHWQGLRGESLDIDPRAETTLTCTKTGATVVYTPDRDKFCPPEAPEGSGESLMEAPIAVFDCETTGLFPEHNDRIVEVAVVLADKDLRPVLEYACVVNPQRDLGPTHIHGLFGKDVVGAPEFKHVADDLVEFFRGRHIVGHNIDFDIRFLRAEFRRLGLSVPTQLSLLDTHSLKRAKLGELASLYGITYTQAHTALGDARATLGVLAALMSEKGLKLQDVLDSGQLLRQPPSAEWPELPYEPTEYTRTQASTQGERNSTAIAYRPGMSVCFTGTNRLLFDGIPLDRSLAQKLAKEKGFSVQTSVTKKLGILIAEDVSSLSGKARKARVYDIPILGSFEFWTSLGVAVQWRE